MIEGKTYKIEFKQQSGNNRWYRWEMSATYLGQSRQQYHLGGDSLFSLRPLAGTTRLPTENIFSTEEVPHHQHKMPKRFPGAIEP